MLDDGGSRAFGGWRPRSARAWRRRVSPAPRARCGQGGVSEQLRPRNSERRHDGVQRSLRSELCRDHGLRQREEIVRAARKRSAQQPHAPLDRSGSTPCPWPASRVCTRSKLRRASAARSAPARLLCEHRCHAQTWGQLARIGVRSNDLHTPQRRASSSSRAWCAAGQSSGSPSESSIAVAGAARRGLASARG